MNLMMRMKRVRTMKIMKKGKNQRLNSLRAKSKQNPSQKIKTKKQLTRKRRKRKRKSLK